MHSSTHLAQYLLVSALTHGQDKNQVRPKGHCRRVRAHLFNQPTVFYSCALVSLVQPELEKAR